MAGVYIKIDIGGKSRGFKLGLKPLSQTLNALNIGIEQIDDAMKRNPVETIATLMFNAAAYNCTRAGETIDFTQDDVYDWLDDSGLQSGAVTEFIGAYVKSMTEDTPKAEKK